MRVVLPGEVSERLRTALRQAGSQEIGGVLMGEHIREEVFAVRDITIQSDGGSFASFMRAVIAFLAPLERFFHRTGQQYRRFNYLGEWHSHPSFSVQPSTRDIETVRDIVEDVDVGANFALLMIVRMDQEDLQVSATAIPRGRPAESVAVQFGEDEIVER